MDNKYLANLIFPNINKTIEDYEKMYPERDLKEGAIVTRFAPSPTGFVHMGSLRSAFIAKKAAFDTDGVFYLRLEDTDQKREVENGIEGIISDFKNFNFDIEEGVIGKDKEIGNYGPYVQSKRKEIYQTFIKELIEKGLAYPCFCSAEELDDIRVRQEKRKIRIGYYGVFAKCRKFSIEEACEKIKNGEKYIIRLKSPGNFERKIRVKDLVKGDIEFPENDLDIVIMKSDGLPTYHFAHLVDDHLMRTTHIIRADEWVSSLPVHVQLFQVFNFKVPKYAHLSPVEKMEGNSRRKLSKRKDPEAAVSYYEKMGIPTDAVYLYLMTTANSNFESWYDCNKDKTIDDFKFDFKKISSNGSLFDLEKLLNISKNYISRLKAVDVYDSLLKWANKYDQEFSEILNKYKDYSIDVLNIEREQKKPRKDFACYSEIKDQIWYMYDEYFKSYELNYEWQEINNIEEIKLILDKYVNNYYDINDDKETWFNKMKDLCREFGYASEVKEYKENPDNYNGHVGDISMIIRVCLTTKSMTPDLYEIMKLLGIDKIKERIGLIK